MPVLPTEQHDLRLVTLAALICIAACLISVNLFVRANDVERNRPLPWLFVAATVFGAGGWATHFISELAFEPGFPIGRVAGARSTALGCRLCPGFERRCHDLRRRCG